MKRDEFPILQQRIADKPLVYLDTAASAQKPQSVLDAIQHYYQHDHANVHRGVHTLSERATHAYEAARETVRQFLNALHAHEIIFTRGATDSINLVAASMGRLLKAGDEIIVSEMEHHANIVPWQVVCEQTGAQLRVIPMLDDGGLSEAAYRRLLTDRTRLVALTHVSHVLGTINPVRDVIRAARERGIPVLLDGAQASAHFPVDVQTLDCDFYVFSGHKLYGPTGIGVLYGKSAWLEKMPPYQTGGGMIRRVSFAKTEYAELPAKFEAGTPPIAGAVGLAAAIRFIEQIGWPMILSHECELTGLLLQRLTEIPALRLLKAPAVSVQSGVVSFTLPQAHAHDIATVLNSEGVAVRAGHHCAMPLLERLGTPATVRVSLGLYNQPSDIDCLIEALHKVIRLFKI
jgi:cysteine desulfurase / selenocysteine lyase